MKISQLMNSAAIYGRPGDYFVSTRQLSPRTARRSSFNLIYFSPNFIFHDFQGKQCSILVVNKSYSMYFNE